ncbi:MAG: hypothetical protein C0434_07885 [Xanthomonadaceae bacterium]|nr:hypothetical protein [Xanthomonadaceae bacterium]
MIDACHGASVRAGWWHHAPTGRCLSDVIAAPCTDEEKLLAGALYGQKLALVHSELSESLEGHRKGLMDEHLPHRKSAEVELADAMIRILDLAGAMQFDLGAAVAEKLAYNAQRADHKPDARAAAGGKAY